MLRATLVTVIAAALAVLQAGCATSQEPGSGSGRTAPPAVASQVRLTYEIVRIQDTSMGHVRRYKYKVRVSRRASEGEIRNISRQIIGAAPPHNGMDIFFYLPGTDIGFVYTAGRAQWWPNGKIGDASEVRTGDYSRHRLVIDVI